MRLQPIIDPNGASVSDAEMNANFGSTGWNVQMKTAELAECAGAVLEDGHRQGFLLADWKAAGATQYHTTLATDQLMMSGLRMPVDFNRGLQVFLSEGTEDSDDNCISREPTDTRRFATKTSANKIICAVWN